MTLLVLVTALLLPHALAGSNGYCMDFKVDVEGTTCPQKLNMDLKFCVDKDPSVSKADMDTGAGVFMREAKAGWG